MTRDAVPSAPLTVIARLEAKAGREGEVAAALRSIIEPTQAEEGCRRYVPFVVDGRQDCFVVYEQWRDDAALDAHFDAPHMADFLAAVPAMLAKPVQLERLRELS